MGGVVVQKIQLATKGEKQVVDITEEIHACLREIKAEDGLVNLFLTHTTAALATADLDPGTDLDMLDAFDRIIPDLKYRHPHNPGHVGDHILSTLIGTSLTLPVVGGHLPLGAWQRVVLIEFDGPRKRDVMVQFLKDG